jgi:hypothetical protein
MASLRIQDRTPFWGLKTVRELKYLQQILNKKVPTTPNQIERQCFNKLFESKR